MPWPPSELTFRGPAQQRTILRRNWGSENPHARARPRGNIITITCMEHTVVLILIHSQSEFREARNAARSIVPLNVQWEVRIDLRGHNGGQNSLFGQSEIVKILQTSSYDRRMSISSGASYPAASVLPPRVLTRESVNF